MYGPRQHSIEEGFLRLLASLLGRESVKEQFRPLHSNAIKTGPKGPRKPKH